jgi:hypothetical protein
MQPCNFKPVTSERLTQKHDFRPLPHKIIRKNDDIRPRPPASSLHPHSLKEPAMTKNVLTFGLIAGLIISVLSGSSMLIADKIGFGHGKVAGMVIGYTIMVASFLLIYFGIRSYRDNTLQGQISFGRAFACGILIALITTVCYVAMWEILYFNFMPHSMDRYFAQQIQRVQSSGLDPATTAARVAAIQHTQQLYQTPLVNIAYTFMEPLPVGLLITLISAAILRRKTPPVPTPSPAVMTT